MLAYLTIENGDYNDCIDVDGDVKFELDAGGADFVLVSKNKITAKQQDAWFKFLKEVTK